MGSIPTRSTNYEMLGSPVTPPALGAGELAGSNPAISTIISQHLVSFMFFYSYTFFMQITQGDTVKIHYVGTLNNGEEFDNSYKREEPIEFEAGAGRMIKGFDDGIIGLSVGDKKTLTLTPEMAYGERVEDAIQEVPRGNFPPDFDAQVGAMVEGRNEMGMPLTAVISGSNNENIILDFNHPLAGQSLNFDVEVVDIQRQ